MVAACGLVELLPVPDFFLSKSEQGGSHSRCTEFMQVTVREVAATAWFVGGTPRVSLLSALVHETCASMRLLPTLDLRFGAFGFRQFGLAQPFRYPALHCHLFFFIFTFFVVFSQLAS